MSATWEATTAVAAAMYHTLWTLFGRISNLLLVLDGMIAKAIAAMEDAIEENVTDRLWVAAVDAFVWMALRTFATRSRDQEWYKEFREKTRRQYLDFPRLCTAIRRNEPAITEVHDPAAGTFRPIGFPEGYGRKLARALLRNTRISKISIVLDEILPFIERRPEIAIEMLVDYIRTSGALRELTLALRNMQSFRSDLLEPALLHAAAENKHLEVLNIESITISSSTLVHVLQTTTSIRKLLVDEAHIIGRREGAVCALATSQTLNHLVLHPVDWYGGVAPMLASFGSESNLTELELTGLRSEFSMDQCEELAAFLERTTKLEHLALSEVVFPSEVVVFPGEAVFPGETNTLHRILRGLRANRSLIKLSLRNVVMDQHARHELTDFFQEADSTEAPALIRELCISRQPIADENLAFYIFLMISSFERGPTRGSKLETLHMDIHADVPLISRLGTFAKSVRLPCLQVTSTYRESVEAWCDTLPKHLRELTFSENGFRRFAETRITTGELRSLAAAMKKNGSLRVFRPPRCTDETVASAKLLRQLQAYVTRNKLLPEMLAAPMLSSSEDDAITTSDTDDDSAASSTGTTNVMHFPALFDAAMPSPKFAFDNVLIGLLASGVAVGR